MPAQAAILSGTFVSGHEEDSNPRRLGRRDTRSVTGVPDFFNKARKV